MKGIMEFTHRPSIVAEAAAVGKKERRGPLGRYFDIYDEDTTLEQDTWEKAESELQCRAYRAALEKSGLEEGGLEAVFGGDLQAQCTATNYSVRASGVPFVGLYGACSTMAESLLTAAAFVGAGYVKTAAAMTSSHFCAAERQFRFPLEYGGMRTPTSQWTVTGAGCCILSADCPGTPYVSRVQPGRVVDFGVTDINNMGAAMAPAAADSLLRWFRNSSARPGDYDGIFTGDLGAVGSELLLELLQKEGVELKNHFDCGKLIFDLEKDGVNAGGSGCGCSASVLCGFILRKMREGSVKKVLFAATGALMSSVTFMQGESIPGIAHVVELRSED